MLSKLDLHAIYLMVIAVPVAALLGGVWGAWVGLLLVEVFILLQATLIRRGVGYLVINSLPVLMVVGGVGVYVLV